MTQGFSTSHIWRKLIAIREELEYNIWWKLKGGKSSFWFNNWNGKGALYYVESERVEEEEVEVKEFVTDEGWDEQMLRSKLSEEMVDYIMEYSNIPHIDKGDDILQWTINSQGNFTLKSAWDNLMSRTEKKKEYLLIWTKGLPFNVNFFMWRV